MLIDVTVAAEALRTGDLARAERLARAAAEHSDALDCRLVLAQALAWQAVAATPRKSWPP